MNSASDDRLTLYYKFNINSRQHNNSYSYQIKSMASYSQASINKPHLVCIPLPLQSHIKCMLKLAKLFHDRGFHITFVNTEYTHNRLLKSSGPHALDDFPDFHFRTIPDGLPPSDNVDAPQDILALCDSLLENKCLPLFIDLLNELNDDKNIPTVTRIIADVSMSFTVTAARHFGITHLFFFTIAASSMIDWIPKNKEESSSDQSLDVENPFIKFRLEVVKRASESDGVIVHTFDSLEKDVLDDISIFLPRLYTIGPLQLLLGDVKEDNQLKSVKENLWTEDEECLKWLDSKENNSVIYISFGSLTTMTNEQLVEFGMGLANSKQYFLWTIRPDMLVGETYILRQELMALTKERGMISSWCTQEKVLNHPSLGWFLTHCGWSSVLESLSAGVPMICWPCFGDQKSNCRLVVELGIGVEIKNDVKREDVEKVVKELMKGENGKEMKKKAMEWKALAREATSPNGSSSLNFDKLVNLK